MTTHGADRLTTRTVFKTWWPLAASWILMSLEGPLLSIVIARLANPKIHLAAYGSLVFPIALLIEAPIIMLLAASTALCKDWDAYRKIRRFMHIASGSLTALHAVIALSPLYILLARNVLQVPEEIIAPGRIGLLVMLPWTWSIAYRRFNQGVLIRYGHSMAVGIGTAVRLVSNGTVLAIGYLIGSLPGTVVATAGIAVGVVSEALYAGLRVRPVVRKHLAPSRDVGTPPEGGTRLTYRAFFSFYIPLSLTSLVLLGARPILTAAISRMPNALDSLAVLPVITGLSFLLSSMGIAYSEVVIAHVGTPGSSRTLRRFAYGLVLTTSTVLVLIASTPLSRIWFGTITGLSTDLIGLARNGLWFALLLPAFAVLQSWFQGIILHSRRTRSITEAVLLYLFASTAVLWSGVAWGTASGLLVALTAMTLGEACRSVWLGWRSRTTWHGLLARDAS